ncbi:MAG: hypothetical protein ACTHQQ_11800 [Solirubrobacteraceae bacterium]
MLDVRTHDLSELTDFHNVIPEFSWNRGYTKLLWSGIVGAANTNFITRVGSFPTITASERRTPSTIPAPGLFGYPIDIALVKPALLCFDGAPFMAAAPLLLRAHHGQPLAIPALAAAPVPVPAAVPVHRPYGGPAPLLSNWSALPAQAAG